MRVLIVSESAAAGVGRHVIDLCRGLAAAGDDVHLVYSDCRIDGAFERGLEEIGGAIACEVLEMRRHPHPSDLRVLRQLRRYAAAHGQFDIVHGQSSKGGALARLLRGSPDSAVVYTPHCVYTLNPTLGRLAKQMYGRAELWLAARTDGLIAVSPSEREHLIAARFPPLIVHCVPNGIGQLPWPHRDAARAALGIAPGERVIGSLGRLSDQKNPLLLISAFARVHARAPDCRLLLAGDGPLEIACRRLARQRGIENAIRWLGYRDPVDVLPAFDVFALSSDYEGMPYVLLEALSCGLPIVSTDVGGTSLTVRDGENGRVVPCGDAPALTEALLDVACDDALRKAMATAAARRASEFGVETMVERTREVYRQALQRRRERGFLAARVAS